MANRMSAGMYYIIDSSEGAAVGLAVPGQSKLQAVGFWASSTAGELIITMGNQTDTLVHFNFLNMTAVNSGVSVVPSWQYQIFPLGLYIQDTMQVPTLTAGTGYLYFA